MVDNIAIPFFEHSWTAEEELLLLEGIEMYGVGNWRDVSEHIGSHSRQDCEEHYVEIYMKSSTKPLPAQLSKEVLKAQATKAAEAAAAAKAAADATEGTEGKDAKVPEKEVDQKEGYVPFQYDSASTGTSSSGECATDFEPW